MVGKNIAYLFKVFKINLANSMALKTDFIMAVIGMFINNIAFIIIWTGFISTAGVINGWDYNDIFGLYAFSFISYGVAHSFFGGISKVPDLITTGKLDRFLYTPKNKILKILTSYFETSAVGDIICGLVCLGIYLFTIEITATNILLIILMIVIACLVHLTFSLFLSAFTFYLMDGKDSVRVLTDLFILPQTYNAGLIQGVLRSIYIFVIPALLCGGLAVELIEEITIQKLLLIFVVSLVWIIVSILFFNKSLKKYESSNFITF